MSWLSRKLAAADRRQLVLVAGIGACTIVTGVAMFSSFYTMVGGEAVGLLFATLFTGLVTCALTVCLHGLVETPRGQGKRTWLAGYLICLAVSLTISYGSFFQIMSSAGLAQDSTRRAITGIAAPLNQFEVAYDELAVEAASLATFSKQQEQEEFRRGATCGGQAIPDDGPRRRLREADAATFGEYARHFKERREKVGALIKELDRQAASYEPGRHAEALRAAQTAHAYASALAQDPKLGAWNELLSTRLAQASGTITDAATGKPFSCPDARLAAKMRTARATGLPAFPSAAPDIKAPGLSDSIKRGFGLLTGDTPFESRRDGPPLALALVVDMLLVIFICALQSHQRRAANPDSMRAAPQDAPEALRRALNGASILSGMTDDLARSLGDGTQWALVTLIDANSVTAGGTTYLVVPEGRKGPRLRRLATLLVAAKLARLHHVTRADRLGARWRAKLGGALDGAGNLQVYALRKGALVSLVVDALKRAGPTPAEAPATVEPAAANAASDPSQRRVFRTVQGGDGRAAEA